MKQILEKIQSAIPENVRLDLTKRIATSPQSVVEISKNLKQMAENNYEIRSILFKNNESAIYFSGDILAKTLYNFWIKGGNIEEHFIENAQMTSYSSGFECIW
jgi:hypothetical protein